MKIGWLYKYATVQFLLVGFELMFRAWVTAFKLCFPKEKEDEPEDKG